MSERLTAEREAAYRKAAARLDVREVHTAEVEAERFAAMTLLLVGVNDLLAELRAVRAERDAARDATMREVAVSLNHLESDRDAAIARAERAEAGLAAVCAAASGVVRQQLGDDISWWANPSRLASASLPTVLCLGLAKALANAAQAAEAYTRRVRAEGEDAARQTALDALRAWRADGNRNAPIYGPATHILDALRVDTFYEKLLARAAEERGGR